MSPARPTEEQLQQAARELQQLAHRYLGGKCGPGSKALLEPTLAKYIASPSRAQLRQDSLDFKLASAAWQIWLRNGNSLPEALLGVNGLRAEYAEPLLPQGTIVALRGCFDKPKSGPAPSELKSVDRIYRLIACCDADKRGGVRPERETLLMSARAIAAMKIAGIEPAQDLATAEFVDTTEL